MLFPAVSLKFMGKNLGGNGNSSKCIACQDLARRDSTVGINTTAVPLLLLHQDEPKPYATTAVCSRSHQETVTCANMVAIAKFFS
jgi:hypothetical protein